jgi:DNA-binding NarL/FixJ family response regulator
MIYGRSSQEYAQRCLEVGMSDVLFKPLRREDLVAALRKWTPETPLEMNDSASASPPPSTSPQPPSSLQLRRRSEILPARSEVA